MEEYINELKKAPLLSVEETNDLITKYQNTTNEKYKIEIRNKLVLHNMRLVLKIAHKYKTVIQLPLDDLINIGSIGLMKSIESFRFGKNSYFSTFAYSCIKNEYLQHIVYWQKEMRDYSSDVSSQKYINTNKSECDLCIEDTFIDQFLTPEEHFDNNDMKKKIHKLLESLNEDELQIIISRFGLYDNKILTYKDIGNLFSVSKQAINIKEKRILEKIRKSKHFSYDLINYIR